MNWQLYRNCVTVGLAAAALVTGVPAWSECACYCMNGERRTLCTDLEEARENPDLCPPVSQAACPTDADSVADTTYDAPDERATNCRDVRIYDALKGAYVTVRACNVL